MHKLEYFIGNKLKETILWSAPKALCLSTQDKLKKSTHKLGTLTINKL
jgi:hypothetical protein